MCPPGKTPSAPSVLSIIISQRLSKNGQIEELFRSGLHHTVCYMDEDVMMFYDRGIKDIPELDEAIGEAMGEDEGENFDYDGNLDQ